jgi:hypothetical protein
VDAMTRATAFALLACEQDREAEVRLARAIHLVGGMRHISGPDLATIGLTTVRLRQRSNHAARGGRIHAYASVTSEPA